MKRFLNNFCIVFALIAFIYPLGRTACAYQIAIEKSDNPLVLLSSGRIHVAPVENLVLLPEGDDNRDTLVDLLEKIGQLDLLAAVRCIGVVKIYVKQSANLDFAAVEMAMNNCGNLSGNYQILLVE